MSKNVLFILITCLIIVFSILGCKGDAGPLEDVTDQVTLSSSTGKDLYTYPGSALFLYVKCNNSNNLPDDPVYVWTIIVDGNIINEIIHDEYIPLGQDDDNLAEGEERWPNTDEIKYEFLQAGTYIIRIDLYDNKEYKTLKSLAARRGTYTYTVYCETPRITLTATPTGESREYTFKATVENPKVLGYCTPRWIFIDWVDDPQGGALDDDGKTEIMTEKDSLGFPTGVFFATHQFQRDDKYRIVFSLKDNKENKFANTDIALEITGVELAIRVPELPLKTGQEYTFTAQNDYPEKMPEDPVYEWDFGDNNGKIIPFSNEVTHLYQKDGTYTIRVLLFESDEEAAPLLEVATAEVKVEASANHLIELHQMKKFSLDFAVQHDYVEGMSDRYSWDFESYGEVLWDGVNFSMQWEQYNHSEVMTGRVSEDGMVIEQLKIRHEFKASDGSLQWAEIEIADLPFWTDTMPDRFIVSVSDEDVQNYIAYFNTYRTAGYQWTSDAMLHVKFQN